MDPATNSPGADLTDRQSLYSGEDVSGDDDDSVVLISQLAPNSSHAVEGRFIGRRFSCTLNKTYVAANVLGLSALSVFAYLLSQEYVATQPDAQKLTGYHISAGAIMRALIETNLSWVQAGDQNVIRKINDFSSRFSFEIYEILWNAFINVENRGARLALSAPRQMLIGYNFTGDGVTFVRIKKSERPPFTLDVEKRVYNPLLRPAYNNSKGQMILQVVRTAFGVSLIVTGEILKEPVKGSQTLFVSFGCFFSTIGVGNLGMDLLLRLWKKYEQKNRTASIDINAVSQKATQSFLLKWLRVGAKGFQRIGSEAICVIPIFIPSEASWVAFAVLGALYGSIDRITQEKVETMTPEEFEIRQEPSYETQVSLESRREMSVLSLNEGARDEGENTIVRVSGRRKRLAVKVNQAATISFFTLFVGWFTYGLVVSPSKQQTEIGVLMTATLVSAAIGRLFKAYFRPGIFGRILNEISYNLIYNPYLVNILYQSFEQISEINNESLDTDSKFDFYNGLLALAMFGMALGVNQLQDYRKSDASPPVYRSRAILDVLTGFHDKSNVV